MRSPEFWARDGLLPRLLAPAGWGVALAGRLRWRLARPFRAKVPVVCVGNLVAGGAGKTPVALALAKLLGDAGQAPHFLTRGYGGRLAGPLRVDSARHGAGEVGDEPLLLAAAAPTWVARDRAAGARAAVAGGAKLLLLDDGFQNPGLAKDLSLVVVDGGTGFGNGRVMPAGPLREPVETGLARGNAVVLVGEDRAGVERRVGGRLPLFRARLRPRAPERLAGKRVLAFAGIGRPAKFFATLEEAGAELVERREFPDHHPYRDAEVAALLEQVRAAGAIAVTTAKDRVRLPPALRERIVVLEVELAWEDETAISGLLRRFVLSPPP